MTGTSARRRRQPPGAAPVAPAAPANTGEWPADRVERRDVAALTPYARNARTHSPEQIEAIAASIRQWGWTMPVLVDERGEIIAGHARVLAAQRLGLEQIPVMVARGWSDQQRRAYVLADNKLALNSGWDEGLLKAEMADLQGLGFDLALTGFSLAEIGEMFPADPAPAPAAGRDPDDAMPDPPRVPITRRGDLWLLGQHRLLCGDSTDAAAVATLIGGERAALLFTSPPYGNQREYTTGGISDWDGLMQGVFAQADQAMADDGQILVNLGLTHRENEWHPYWSGWLDWMRARGWRRFGLYTWDQGPGLPGDWNGRLAPAFEFVFHFNRQSRQANKIVPCKWAGTPKKGSGLREADGTMSGWTHEGRPIQDFRIPDSVIRITRHQARGIETEHPAVFPVLLPDFVMRSYTDEGQVVFEPFSGSGTTILAGQGCGRRVRAMEFAPEYVDLAIERWKLVHPSVPVVLAADGRRYEEVKAERQGVADAA